MEIKMKHNKLFSILLFFSLILVSSCDNTSSSNSSGSSETNYNLSISTNGEGVVNGGTSGTYDLGTEFNLVAVPNSVVGGTNSFVNWTEGESIISTNPEYTFTINRDLELTANFVFTPNGNNTKVATFSHKWNGSSKGDFKSGGGSVTANGLNWTYSSFTYLGQGDKGAQIGSANNPQKTPWILSTQFGGEVKVLSYTYIVSCASQGNFNATVDLGEAYTKTDNCQISASLANYTYEDLDVSTSSFSLTLVTIASKAMYLNTISFTLEIPDDLQLDISIDVPQPITLVPGDNVPSIKFPATSLETYYSGVDLNATGTALVTSLRSKISNFTRTTYGDAKTMLCYTDESVANPGFLYGMWDGDLLPAEWGTGVWEREHVWACANMGLGGDLRPGESTKNQGSDLQNLRAACSGSNGKHGNNHFDNDPAPAGYFYPNPAPGSLAGDHAYTGDFRGDLARILFYMYTCYDFLSLTDAPNGNNNTGKLSRLIEWNKADPVDDFEIQRNNRVYGYQGNRNPFIDYPALADKIDFSIAQ
jgi:endonuclease I